MAFDYKGVVIPEEVIIVENSHGQGYVVEKGNDKMLETAKSWATPYIWNAEKQQHEYITPENNIHEYKNGAFEFELLDSAGGSSQGGKLSFWNCKITDETGKSYEIGINSEILLNLLKYNSFVNGKLQGKCYLGRIRGNQVGAFTENMEYFEQAKKDKVYKEAMKKKTVKYVTGDIIGTLTSKKLYVGKLNELFAVRHIKQRSGYSWRYDYKSYLVVHSKPQQTYVYRSAYNESYSGLYLENKKKPMTVIGHDALYDNYSSGQIYELACKYYSDDIQEAINRGWSVDSYQERLDKFKLQYSSTESVITKEELAVRSKNLLKSFSWYSSTDVSIVTEEEFETIIAKEDVVVVQ